MNGSFTFSCSRAVPSGVLANRPPLARDGDGVTTDRVCLFPCWFEVFKTGTLLAPDRLSSSSGWPTLAVNRFLELDIGIFLPTTEGKNKDGNSQDFILHVSFLVNLEF